ncbi:hypothetical protein AVMA1855_03775 [Acidovorax sp. SUPP1855]|uniref:hypothetical protein n=1 Tax=Acidovorax sp. SUPP1855 TaxID=431774 RepID=UPI0023DE321F|nr:hypothetical protein [Acidovorax sp. SUPP1855]GKS83229.1 hypothetical protein AVMA1855_03775 [Acidovorax sp. SUPP1855]
MKVTIHLICGAVLGVVLGVLASAAWDRLFGAGYPLGEERSNMLALLLVFGIIPASALAGALAGYALYRRARKAQSS